MPFFLPFLYEVGIISEFSGVAGRAGGASFHHQPDFAMGTMVFPLLFNIILIIGKYRQIAARLIGNLRDALAWSE